MSTIRRARSHAAAGARLASLLAPLALSILAPTSVRADDIDLTTVPSREGVQLTIYNAEDLTLVRETRRLTFREGVNRLQFSWAGTLIDPSSLDIRFRSHDDALEIVDTTYPHERPQMLYWTVDSRIEGDALVEISYFTSGLTWAADFVAVTDAAEEKIDLDGFVRLTNNSGESYDDAQVRLVVGQINLVERIADLARRGIVDQRVAEGVARGGRVRDMPAPARRAVAQEMQVAMDRMAPDAASAPPEIVKEGLSEYFIYTIDAALDVEHGWSRRFALLHADDVPFDVEYRYRPREYGERLARFFLLANDEKHQLGTTPLPDGLVRVFRRTGDDGLAWVARHPVKYTPIGQNIEIDCGDDPEVVHERVLLRQWRSDFWFRRDDHTQLYSPDKGDRIEPNFALVGWNQHERRLERLRNWRDEAVVVRMRLPFDGDCTFVSESPAKSHDYRTVELELEIPPRRTEAIDYELDCALGTNARQNRVRIGR